MTKKILLLFCSLFLFLNSYSSNHYNQMQLLLKELGPQKLFIYFHYYFKILYTFPFIVKPTLKKNILYEYNSLCYNTKDLIVHPSFKTKKYDTSVEPRPIQLQKDHNQREYGYLMPWFFKNIPPITFNKNSTINIEPISQQNQNFLKQDQDYNVLKQPNQAFKQEFINLIYLLQDHNDHAKKLACTLQYERKTIKEKFNIAAKNFIDKLSKISIKKENGLFSNNPDHMELISLAEALFLKTITTKQIQKNKNIYKLIIGRNLHPDGLAKNEIILTENDQKNPLTTAEKQKNEKFKEIITAVNDISNSLVSLLKQNIPDKRLSDFKTEINSIVIPEPSFIKKNILDVTNLITEIAALTIGYNTFADIKVHIKEIPGTITAQTINHSIFNDDRPNIKSTAELQQICKTSMVGHLLMLDKKLQTLKRHN